MQSREWVNGSWVKSTMGHLDHGHSEWSIPCSAPGKANLWAEFRLSARKGRRGNDGQRGKNEERRKTLGRFGHLECRLHDIAQVQTFYRTSRFLSSWSVMFCNHELYMYVCMQAPIPLVCVCVCVCVFSIIYGCVYWLFLMFLGYGQLLVLDESLSVQLVSSWYQWICTVCILYWAKINTIRYDTMFGQWLPAVRVNLCICCATRCTTNSQQIADRSLGPFHGAIAVRSVTRCRCRRRRCRGHRCAGGL